MNIIVILITYPDGQRIVEIAYSDIGAQNTIDEYKRWFWEERTSFPNYEDAEFELFEKYIDIERI